MSRYSFNSDKVQTKPIKPLGNWPVTHLNGGIADRSDLVAHPSLGQSYYITGFLLSGGGDGDGFNLIRQCCLNFTATYSVTFPEDGSQRPAAADFSIGLWFRWSSGTPVGAVGGLLSKIAGTDGYKWEILSDGTAKFTFGDGTNSVNFTTDTNVCDGNWHHLVATVDRDQKEGFKIYVDNVVEKTSDDDTSDPTDVTGAVNATGVDTTLAGTIIRNFYVAQFFIASTACITAAQVSTNYNGGMGKKFVRNASSDNYFFTPGLSSNFDVGRGATVYDTSCNNNGTASISTMWSTGAGIPIGESLPNIDKINCVSRTDIGTPSNDHYESYSTCLTFPHAIKIGNNNPLAILETDGNFTLVLFGFTDGD